MGQPIELHLSQAEIEACKLVLKASPSSDKKVEDLLSNSNLRKHFKDEPIVFHDEHQVDELYRAGLDYFYNHKKNDDESREHIQRVISKLEGLLLI